MYCYTTQSLAAAGSEPSALIASSTDLRWRSALLRIYRSIASCAPFETIATPDQTIVVHLAGRSELKVFSRGMWHATVTQPGSVGLTPAGDTSRLQWRALEAEGCVSAHLHLPQGFLDEAADHYMRPGATTGARQLNASSTDDAGVASIVRAIVAGLEAGEGELFLEAALYQLAHRLLHPDRRWDDDRPGSDHVSDRRISRAIDYMSRDLAITPTLAAVAREAGISKFHFVRSFRHHVGLPPHAFLKDVRLTTAQRMLRAGDLPVATIAGLVGYETARNFSSAFTRHFGMTPSQARRETARTC